MKNIFTILISIISLTTFGQNWNEVIKAVASDREAEDHFGFSVSISGNIAIVGAKQEDANTGAAYIFELNNNVWSETTKLVASDKTIGDEFGFSVSIQGNRAIVGARLDNEDASGANPLVSAGAAYIFELDNGVWSETAKLVASDRTAEDQFGISVAIDDDKAIIGAFYNDTDLSGANIISKSGAAYIFELNGISWTETTKIVASDRTSAAEFGRSVGISNDKIIVGAHFERKDENGLNSSVKAGAAYVYELIAGVWSETSKLVASDRESYAYFGSAVSISGNKIIVGSFLKDELLLGGITYSNVGAAYIFEHNGTAWVESTKLTASDKNGQDYFGSSVSISGDRVIVGANQQDLNSLGSDSLMNAGAAYIFELENGTWTQVEKLVASDRETADYFGRSVGVSNNKVIVGAFLESENSLGTDSLYNAGSIYMYMTCNSSVPTVTSAGQTLSSSNTGGTYQWIDCSNGNSMITAETNQSFTATENGEYAVITTENGCSDTSACVNVSGVGINSVNDINNVYQLFPNPTTSQMTISNFNSSIKNVRIVDITGKLIKSFVPKTEIIDVIDLQKGIYFVEIDINGKISSQKLIKQ